MTRRRHRGVARSPSRAMSRDAAPTRRAELPRAPAPRDADSTHTSSSSRPGAAGSTPARSRSRSRRASCSSCSPRARPRNGPARCSWLTSMLLFGNSALYHRFDWEPEDQGRPQAHRPREHLPADRRHLHADRGARAAAPTRRCCCSRSSGAARSSASCSACSGSTRRAGCTSRSTSLLGWAAVMYLVDLFAGERRHDDARDRRRPALHRRRRRLRDEAAEPVAGHLRLPRDLPRRARCWRSCATGRRAC